ncbi:YqaA family protein [Leptolyngbya sp. PCC 6406]|uniref:YqaA family protein n=1 Tax=Leptolyngbya sp. PCC 6406 TaxID=1173264 RepID=UPI0002ACB2E1|nr:YqaA family protein [Leptolyngbya sp. PCC 6406]
MPKLAYSKLAEWSHKPQGVHLLFWYALAESCIIPVPVDPLLITLCAGAPTKSLRFGLICGAGSVVGGVLGYALGHYAFDSLGQTLLQFYDPDLATFQRVEDIYAQWGFWGVLMAAVTPIPYKIFTIASGVFDLPFWQFLLASMIGRNVRFVGVAMLMAVGGDRLHHWQKTGGVPLAGAIVGGMAVLTLVGVYSLTYL